MSITLLDKILFRLFILPVSIIISGLVIFTILANLFNSLNTTNLFYPIIEQIFRYFAIGSLLLSAGGFLWLLINIFHFGTWYLGKSKNNVCFNCGGIIEYRSGRFGEYTQCLGCGKRKKLHY